MSPVACIDHRSWKFPRCGCVSRVLEYAVRTTTHCCVRVDIIVPLATRTTIFVSPPFFEMPIKIFSLRQILFLTVRDDLHRCRVNMNHY